MRLAAIDIGSNSVKLTVSDRTDAGLRDVVTRVKVTRLAEGMRRTKALRLDAMDRTLEAVSEFRWIALQKGAKRLLAVATEALRSAKNQREFLVRCEYEAQVIPRVLSSQEEARLSFLGGTSGLRFAADRLAAMDIGGSSTEVMVGSGRRLDHWRSFPLGVVGMSERFLRHDPPGVEMVERMIRYATYQMHHMPSVPAGARLVSIGGVPTTLVSILLHLNRMSNSRVHGRGFKVETAVAVLKRLAVMKRLGRKRVRGLDPARADVILPGLAILIAAAQKQGIDRVTASARGLRHGVLLSERTT